MCEPTLHDKYNGPRWTVRASWRDPRPGERPIVERYYTDYHAEQSAYAYRAEQSAYAYRLHGMDVSIEVRDDG